MNYQASSDSKKSSENRDSLFGFYGFATVLIVLMLVACAPPSNSSSPKNAVDPYAHLDAEEKLAMSEILADDAEEKMGFDTMNEAWGKFSEALQLNPENQRAIFWKEILKPILDTKGIVARVRPLYLKQRDGLARYTAMRRGLEKSSSKSYARFLVAGPDDIDTDEKFLAWIDQTITNMDTLRTFLKANKDRTYSLRAPSQWLAINGIAEKKGDRCAALKVMSTTFTGCPESGMLRFKVNRADLEMLQIYVSVQMVNLALLYAYKINPITMMDNQGGLRSLKNKIADLTNGYDGSLMAKNRLSIARSMTADLASAQRFVMQNQEELCSSRNSERDNRPGFLFSSGFCVNDRADTDTKILDMFETLTLGKPVEVEQRYLSEPIYVDVMKFINAPPANILPFAPTKYTEDGNLFEFSDSTYSPYFSGGSINDILRGQREEAAANAAERARWMQGGMR